MPCMTFAANCQGPAVALLRCANCTRAAGDVTNVRARRQSITNLGNQRGINALSLQGAWTDRAATIVENMYDDFFRASGGPPCPYAFCWAGSGARREACPYSDVDGFIVLDEGSGPAEKQAFNAASADVLKRLKNMLVADGGDKGFTFCTGGLNPLARADGGVPIIQEGLTGTAVELAGIVELYLTSNNEFVQHLVAGLSDCSLAFGEDRLFRAFKTEADLVLGQTCWRRSWRPALSYRRRMALAKIQDVSTDAAYAPPGPNATRFELKKQFYRVPQFIAQALCWWHELDGITTDQQITALVNAGKISHTNSARFRLAMEAPLVVRVKSHLHANKEQEWVRTPAHPGADPNPNHELILTANDEFRLRRAAVALGELRVLGQRFYATKTKAFGKRRSPFYDA